MEPGGPINSSVNQSFNQQINMSINQSINQPTNQVHLNPLQTRPTLNHTSQLDWRHQPAGTLEIWLDQKPVHHCCPVEDGPQSASGSYLHRIGRQQSPVCLYCGGDDQTAQHLLCCPSHSPARTSTNYINSTDTRVTRRMWSFLESIRAVTHPQPEMRERERLRESTL